MTLHSERDQVAQMYDVAEDDELAPLDALAERAGLRWTCQPKPEHPHAWTNHAGEACEQCERTQQEARDYDEQTDVQADEA